MKVLIEQKHGCDLARELGEDELKKRLKDKSIVLVEGIIYREQAVEKKAKPKKTAAKKGYKTKVVSTED